MESPLPKLGPHLQVSQVSYEGFSWTCLYNSTKDFKQDLVSGSCQFCWKSQMWCQVFTKKMSLKHGYHESIHECFKVGEPQKIPHELVVNIPRNKLDRHPSWIKTCLRVPPQGKKKNILTLQGTRTHIPPHGEVWNYHRLQIADFYMGICDCSQEGTSTCKKS